MIRIGQFIGYIILMSLVSGVGVTQEATLRGSASSTHIAIQRHTWKELRDQYVIKQKKDYSCGAAALATLMIYYYGDDTSEKEILDLLKVQHKKLTKKERSRKKMSGFSLFDLKQVAQQKGYKAAGFKVKLEQLRLLAAPVLVYVEPMGYHHFSVLRGVVGDKVFLADPSRGNISMSAASFEDEYGGILFVLGREGEEKITDYPLALSRPDDYVRPDPDRVINRLNDFGSFMNNLALRTRFPR